MTFLYPKLPPNLFLVLPNLLPFSFGEGPSKMGDLTTVQCSMASGDIPVKFSWYLNGKPVQQSDGINVGTFGSKTSFLSIDSLAENHAGNYTCLAQNSAGLSSYTAELTVMGTPYFTLIYFVRSLLPLTFFLIPTVLPKLLPFTFGEEASNLGESTTVQCSLALGDLPVNFTWFLNDEGVDGKYGISTAIFGKKTSVLSIDSLDAQHAGNYTCVAQNAAGQSSHSSELKVMGIFVLLCNTQLRC